MTGELQVPQVSAAPIVWTPKGQIRLPYRSKDKEKRNGRRQREREVTGYIRIGDDGKPMVAKDGGDGALSPRIRRDGVACQIFPPFLVAGLGMVAAGILLSKVKHWPVFLDVDEMLILVPALLGLKGNLEMTLASRLSTHANLGELDGLGASVRTIIVSNLAVVQCQAIIVGAIASAVAFGFQLLMYGHANEGHGIILAVSAVTAASVASLVLSTAMIAIVIVARKHGVDPDNVAGPIAGMLGDFCTLGLLALIAQSYFDIHHGNMWLLYLVLACYVGIAEACRRLGRSHEATGAVLVEGWLPVILSMFISSLGGVILRHSVARFHYLSPFAPVMNGAGGNLAAVQSARLSTDLHAHGHPGVMPHSPSQRKASMSEEDEPLTPRGTFTDLLSRTNDHAATARVLIALAIPGAVVFVTLIVGIKSHFHHLPEPLFVTIYVCATMIQVCVLLVFAHGIVGNLWLCFVNPDNAAIPYVTSVGDVVGTSCLTMCFALCAYLGVEPFPGAEIGPF